MLKALITQEKGKVEGSEFGARLSETIFLALLLPTCVALSSTGHLSVSSSVGRGCGGDEVRGILQNS